MLSALDLQIRRTVLTTFASGGIPTRAAVGHLLGLDGDEVAQSYAALAEAHVVVLDAVTGEVWMALPFSAVPTEFRVVTGEVAVWANCAWDAFGVAAALDCDVSFATPCPATGTVITGGVRRGVAFVDAGVVARVGVPASRWWDDVGYT